MGIMVIELLVFSDGGEREQLLTISGIKSSHLVRLTKLSRPGLRARIERGP